MLQRQDIICTNQQPLQRGGAVPDPVWVGSKWLLAFPRVPVTPGTPLHFFAMLPPERPQKGSTQLLQNWSLLRSPIRSSPTDGRTDSFSPSILPSSRNLFILGDFNCHHPLWDSRGTSDPAGRKYSTGSSLPTSSSSMTPTHPPFSIAPLAVALLLAFSLLPLLLPFLAPGRCFRTSGSPYLSSSSLDFPNCSSPRESASVYAAYLRSHFSVSQSKALRTRARGYLTQLRRATCPVESHSSFCSPFSPAEFHAAASNLASSTAISPEKVAYPMLKHLPRSGMDFLLLIFNLSWSLHSFPSPSGRHLLLFPYTRWENLSTFLLPYGLSLSPPAYQSCLNASFYPVFSSFWNLIPFFLPARPVSALDGLLSIKFFTFLSPFRMGLTNPGRALGRSCLLLISLKLLTLSGIPPFSTNSFRLASLLALLVGLNLSFLTGAPVWFIKITKAVPFEFVEVFRKDPFLALYFSLYSSMIFLSLCLLPSAVLFTLTIWPFGLPPPRSPLRWRPHKKLCFDWSTGLSTGVFLSIRANVRPPFFQWIPTKLTSSPTLSYSAPVSVSIPLQLFLGSPSTSLSFSKHVSSLKAKFFSRLKALRCISAFSWGPSKEFLSRLYKSFLRPHLTYASPVWFPFLNVTNITKLERLHRATSRAITGCLTPSLIPLLLLTEASLSPLRVTLTHFTLLSYEWALRFPISFPVSGLARLGVKPRLCRSSWRALASTHPLMLPSTCSREALVACPPCPPWNLPSFTVESTLSTLCSRSDPPFHSPRCGSRPP